MEPNIEIAYAAATQILRDCRHPRATIESNLRGGGHARFCSDCCEAYNAAWKATRKAQLAAHNAKLPDCEGTHAKTTKARWSLAGVQLCGRCKTKAKRSVERKVAQSGMSFLFMMGAARLSREQVFEALR